MLIPSFLSWLFSVLTSLSRRVNANSQRLSDRTLLDSKLIKKGEC